MTSQAVEGGWIFRVRVTGSRITSHRVTLSKNDFDALRKEKSCTPEDLVRKSFEFLLERESNQSILGEFDLMIIGRYFLEFPEEISKRL